MKKRKIELLAPGGDIDSIKAAILAGADAVYCGLDKFNARGRAVNLSFDNLQGILHLAHKNGCQVFLTLNIIIVETEIKALISLLNRLINTSIDGVIVQDPGLFYLLSNSFKSLKIHASTQLTTHNEGQIRFLSRLNASRINLSRELNIREITALTTVAHRHNILTEVFVHGSYCISFSGICYMSSVHGGNSGNRGRCSQPCRDRYVNTAAGKDYPLNLKDNSTFFDLNDLDNAGVDSLKIEGRIKKSDYVYTVVNSWRKQLRSFNTHNDSSADNRDLYKVFNRDFSNGFLKGNISKDLFIDNPRDHSIQHLSEVKTYPSERLLEKDQVRLYEEKEAIKNSVEAKIRQLSVAKPGITIHLSGEYGAPLNIHVKTPEGSFEVFSEMNLESTGSEPITYDTVFKRLKAINETEYYIEKLCLENLGSNVFLPFRELTSLKKRLLYILNGSKEWVVPIQIPPLKQHNTLAIKPSLSVLISSSRDLPLCRETSSVVYFQLPDRFYDESSDLLNVFTKTENLIPWFPSVLIGEDYTAAIEFLKQLQPKLIVTNNTGIAFEAYRMGISWIAGPYLNIVNSLSLICLKEKFNCKGSFISNELSKFQIQGIQIPDDFKLYYSVYHPVLLMTTRQCLFHQVTGCEKHRIDDSCISHCEKSSSITNLKKEKFLIEKKKRNYHTIYHETHFLNTDIVTDMKDLFSGFLIDIREIKTETRISVDKLNLIKLFENLLNEHPNSRVELEDAVQHTTNNQYYKGV